VGVEWGDGATVGWVVCVSDLNICVLQYVEWSGAVGDLSVGTERR
jgi:hypothetical protein